MGKYHNRKETRRVGQQIKQLRLKYGWNIEDISEMTGFSRSTISAVEKGAETDTTHLIEIAKAIGVQPSQIFNISFDLRPRYKLSQKRKDQKKLTLKIRGMIEAGFFKEPHIVNDVREQLFGQQKLKVSAAQISVVLLRLTKEGILRASKSGRKNLYSVK